jgi:hypothetical protein
MAAHVLEDFVTRAMRPELTLQYRLATVFSAIETANYSMIHDDKEPLTSACAILQKEQEWIGSLVHKTTTLPVFQCYHPVVLEYLITRCGVDMAATMTNGKIVLVEYLIHVGHYCMPYTDLLLDVLVRNLPFETILAGPLGERIMDEILDHTPAFYWILTRSLSAKRKKQVVGRTRVDGMNAIMLWIEEVPLCIQHQADRIAALRSGFMEYEKERLPPAQLRERVPKYLEYFRKLYDMPVMNVNWFRWLYEDGLDINHQDHYGYTVLHALIQKIHLFKSEKQVETHAHACIQWLSHSADLAFYFIDWGASPFLRDGDGDTVLDVNRIATAVPFKNSWSEPMKEFAIQANETLDGIYGYHLVRTPTCAYCHTHHEKLKRCVGCRTAQYCSREHYRLHWETHKAACGDPCDKELSID